MKTVLSRDACPECGAEELRPDVTTGETDCVNCGWSVSWLEEIDEKSTKPGMNSEDSW